MIIEESDLSTEYNITDNLLNKHEAGEEAISIKFRF